MGHGPGRKDEGGAKGMRVKEQQQVMEQFKAPGELLGAFVWPVNCSCCRGPMQC